MPTLSSLDAYARWASHYPPRAHNPLMQREEAMMRRYIPDLRGKTVLDLACGTGRYALITREQGAAWALGCDNSPQMLAANPLTTLALADTAAIPLPSQSVDLVLCGLALGHLPQLRPTLREIGRVLKPGALALISDFHPAMARSGGQRTFRDTTGELLAVEHYLHEAVEYREIAQELRLIVAAVDESTVSGAPSAQPAVVVYCLRKPD